MPRPNGRRLSALCLATLLMLLAAAAPVWLQPTARAAGSVFVVNSTADGPDANTSDGLCNDGAGRCTLRAAIQQANATAGTDTINFQIGTGVQTIVLGSTLPDVTDPLVIDGSTQPGYSGSPLVELLGQDNASPPVSWGLRITAGSSTVRALSIGRVSVSGILLGGVGSGGVGGNKVEACYLGLRADGVTSSPAGGGCVSIVDSANNTVGGTNASARNVISNCGVGVEVVGSPATGNLIQGNYIGTNAAGTAAADPSNTSAGVQFRSGANDNTVGGTVAGAGNVISGNRGSGVYGAEGTSANKVQGNLIGLGADGQTRIFNIQDGVFLIGATNYLIGGDTAGARNVLSGNLSDGVHIFSGSGHNIRGNYIGTNAAGTAAAANGENGVFILNSSNNVVGGDTAAARNIISGNTGDGVSIDFAGPSDMTSTTGNAVKGNYIGADVTGTAPIPNITVGVRAGGAGTIVGGLASAPGAAPGNLIAGQFTNLFLIGTGTVVRGNLIGTDVTGTTRLFPLGSSYGISIANSGSATVQGNYIGTDPSGTVAVGNFTAGVEALGNAPNQFGGAAAGAGNLISGNGRGVWLHSNTSVVQGNLIGTDASGNSPLPNGQGIFITSTARNDLIGGTAPGEGNRVAFNIDGGIVLGGDSLSGQFSTGNALRGNSVYSNGRLGIDLIAPSNGLTTDGVTLNDALDADAGPNNLQNAPTVLSASTSGGTTAVQGRLDSKPNQTYAVDIYANASCDPSGHGEGQAYVGTTQATTDAAGAANFAASFPLPSVGQVYTATATDASNNTSEFSVCYEANAPGTVQFTATSFGVAESKGAATVVVTRTLGTAGAASVDYATSDGTATAGSDYTPASGTLNFAPGETTKTFTVALLNDALDEDTETVQLTLSNPTGGINLGPNGTSAVQITDDDPVPTIRISSGIVAEGNVGTASAVFNVTLNVSSGRAVMVSYATENSSAFAPQDYQPASGTLVFNPGETSKQVTVGVNGDTDAEPDETFFLRLSNPVNATLGTSPGTSLLRAFAVIWDDDSPGIHFSAATYSAGEADGSVVIRVVRRGDASSAASVSYSAAGTRVSNDGSSLASQRTDFTPTFGTLDFAPGEAEKSFVVLLNDDAYIEAPEAVTLSLGPPGQLPLTVLTTARLVIASDDTQPPTAANNPLDETQFFVRQHYHDFLSREPDAAGLAFWVGDIEQCGTDTQCREVHRINVSAAFFLSIEFQNTGYQVFRMYRATYPDLSERPRGLPQFLEFLRDTQRVGRGVVVGQAGWEERLRQNKEEFAREWAVSPGFVTFFSGLTTGEQFVDKLFSNLGVTPTTTEREAALAAYGAGDTAGRAAALLSVTESGSVFNKQYNPAFVYMQYVGYLRRAPNEEPDFSLTGFDFWLSKLDSFTQAGEDARDETVAIRRVRRAEMVKAFLSSIEYRQRFGTP